METPDKRPWRSYLRLSLRWLIVLVLGIGGGLSWVVHRAQIQREAVAVLQRAGQRAGGGVIYDWDFQNGTYYGHGKPWWSTWLMDRIGVDYFGHVTWVYLPEVTDAEMVRVGRLSQLERLDLIGSSMTDAKLALLKGLTGLQALSFMDAAITDAGMVHLKGLTRLKDLALHGTKVTDAGLEHLKKMTNLRTLDLRRTKVTDAGVQRLQEALPKLKIIR
jgi:Leucine Rich repeat